MVFDTNVYGETGYVEMYPVAQHEGGILEYEVEFAIIDNLSRDGMLIVDRDATKTKLKNTSISHIFDIRRPEIHRNHILLDSERTRFKVISMLKVDKYVEDVLNMIPSSPMFGDPKLTGWQMTNVFANDPHDLTLYKPMTMMRSVLSFAGKKHDYKLRANLMPFVSFRLAHDGPQLSKFIRQFNEQYAAVEPVLFERLDNNCHLDLKFYNTYGRSNNYYIGDCEQSGQLLDDVNISISFQLSIRDRMAWQATAEAVTSEIREFFEDLNGESQPNVFISNLIRRIENNHPNVSHLKFLGINHYNATEQYIRVRYHDVSDLDKDEMMIVVPEIIQCRPDDIQLLDEG
jgi:hypothetical protein